MARLSYVRRLFFRWFARSLVVSVLFLAWEPLGLFLTLASDSFSNVHSGDLVDIGSHVCWYEERHGGKSAESLQEVYKDLLSEKEYRRYVNEYFLVTKSTPFPNILTDWAVASKRPKRRFFPYPPAKIYYLPKEKVFSDTFEDDNGAKALSVDGSRQFSAWLAQNDEDFNLANQERLFDDYAFPFIVDGVLLSILFLAFIIKVVCGVKKGRKLRKQLQTSYSTILKFLSVYQRSPRSDHEVREKLPDEPFDVGLETPFRYLGDLRIQYCGQTILAATKKTRLSPLFPIFCGKRLLLLLENGVVATVRGSLSTDYVLDKIQVAEDLREDSRTSKSFLSDDMNREKTELSDEKEPSVAPETDGFLSIPKSFVSTKPLRILLPPFLIATFFIAFI